MYLGKTHMVHAMTDCDPESLLPTTIKFLWAPGAELVWYQTCTLDANNMPVFGPMNPDPMSGKTLREYVEACYEGYVIVDDSTDYTG